MSAIELGGRRLRLERCSRHEDEMYRSPLMYSGKRNLNVCPCEWAGRENVGGFGYSKHRDRRSLVGGRSRGWSAALRGKMCDETASQLRSQGFGVVWCTEIAWKSDDDA